MADAKRRVMDAREAYDLTRQRYLRERYLPVGPRRRRDERYGLGAHPHVSESALNAALAGWERAEEAFGNVLESAGRAGVPSGCFEATWRERVTEARLRVEDARDYYDKTRRGHLAQTQRRRSVGDSQASRRALNIALADWELAEKALESVLESARRAGVPSAWLQ